MKTFKFGFLILFLAIFCLIACQKKEALFPDSQTISMAIVTPEFSPPPSFMVSPATTKWVKKKADRKIEEVMEIIGQYYNIPDGGLLALAANCTNRLNIVDLTSIDYELLTLTTEFEDLKRLGINHEEAAILLGALFIGVKEPDGTRHLSLDIEEVSKQDIDQLVTWIHDFVTYHCTDCTEDDIPDMSKLASWIEKAKQLDLFVSYPDEVNRCHYGNGSYQVEVSPGNTKWVKKKTD